MRWLSVALACVTLLTSSPADAFVTPRWTPPRDRSRNAIVGTWRAISYKHHNGMPQIEPEIVITFARTTLRVEIDGRIERGTWRIVDQEGDIVGIEVTDDKGKKHDMDVLIENNTALTLYVEDDDGDDEEVLRVERID